MFGGPFALFEAHHTRTNIGCPIVACEAPGFKFQPCGHEAAQTQVIGDSPVDGGGRDPGP